MPKQTKLPVAVTNLRKIWDSKKAEMKFTQVQAAKELGWTQGAISHYLNNITDLGPAAVVKFANFLGVDPREIDPNVVASLPNMRMYEVQGTTEDMGKKISEKVYLERNKTGRWIRISEGTKWYENGGIKDTSLDGDMCRVCDPSEFPNARFYLVQRKGKKNADIYHENDLPQARHIEQKWAIHVWVSLNRGEISV